MGVLWGLFGNPNGQVFALPVRWHQSPLGSLSGYKYLDNHLQSRGLGLLHHHIPSLAQCVAQSWCLINIYGMIKRSDDYNVLHPLN